MVKRHQTNARQDLLHHHSHENYVMFPIKSFVFVSVRLKGNDH